MAVRIKTLVTGTSSSPIVVADYNSLPSPSTVPGQFYWCSTGVGASWRPAWLGGTYYNAGMYYSNGTTWEFTPIPYNANQATVDAGVNDDQFLTPKTFNDSSQLASKANLSGATFTGSISATNLSGTNTGDETAGSIGIIVNGASSATPNDSDLVATVESSVVKKINWTSIKAFLKTYFDTLYINHIHGINYSAVTGTVGETLVGVLTAPSNFFNTSDSLRIIANCQRSGTTGTAATMRIKINSVNDFATATTIATITTTNSSQNNFGLVRENMTISGGNLTGYPFGTSAITDNALLAITLSSVAVDVTQPLYFFVSLANASTTESNVIRVFKISK